MADNTHVIIHGKLVFLDERTDLWCCANWIEWTKSWMKYWGDTPQEAYDAATQADG